MTTTTDPVREAYDEAARLASTAKERLTEARKEGRQLIAEATKQAKALEDAVRTEAKHYASIRDNLFPLLKDEDTETKEEN